MKLGILLFPLAASAQVLSFGVQGGAPAQTPFGQTNRMPFIVGPAVHMRVLPRLSLETGVLYYRLGREFNNYALTYPAGMVTLGFEARRGSALELPFLARYRFLSERRTWRPFISAGPAVRRTSITARTVSAVIGGSGSGNAAPALNTKTVHWNLDPAAGGGVDIRAGRFHIEPQVRYSYWGAGKTAPVRKNQAAFLLGFRF
ncbi:MAG: PorT family protein [Acidobacteria bacterium]|nr:PorT family protein [Acidobacteriota bacterium]